VFFLSLLPFNIFTRFLDNNVVSRTNLNNGMDEFEWFWIKLPWKQSREKVWRKKEKGKNEKEKESVQHP